MTVNYSLCVNRISMVELELLGSEFTQERYIWFGYHIQDMNLIDCPMGHDYISFNKYSL